MKYKWFWTLAVLFVLIDGGMTAWALNNGYSEQNPTMKDWMDKYGEGPAIVASILIRLLTILFGQVAQLELGFKYVRAIPILFILPASAWPVVHNITVIFL